MNPLHPGPTPAPILPPRPNLGPEPWPDPSLPWGLIGALALFAALALALVLAWWLRRPGRRRSAPAARSPRVAPSDPSPSGRLIAWSDRARAVLVARFGPSWDARTTDEIASWPDLAVCLGPDRAETLVLLLRSADQVKFTRAGETIQDVDWEEWVTSFEFENPSPSNHVGSAGSCSFGAE